MLSYGSPSFRIITANNFIHLTLNQNRKIPSCLFLEDYAAGDAASVLKALRAARPGVRFRQSSAKGIMIKLIKLKSFEEQDYSYFFVNELDERVSKIFTEQEINALLLSTSTEISDDSWTILPR